MRFYLGTHQPAWLARELGVPLLVSHRRLAGRRSLPRATGPWALDSGGFTELSLHGRWRTDAHAYAAAVRRYAAEIGYLDWAPQDWMTENHVLARTGVSLRTHQHRTVTNYLRLRDVAPDLPIIPVLQGQSSTEYHHCADIYERQGIDLAATRRRRQRLPPTAHQRSRQAAATHAGARAHRSSPLHHTALLRDDRGLTSRYRSGAGRSGGEHLRIDILRDQPAPVCDRVRPAPARHERQVMSDVTARRHQRTARY
jgi:hypothetical protein